MMSVVAARGGSRTVGKSPTRSRASVTMDGGKREESKAGKVEYRTDPRR